MSLLRFPAGPKHLVSCKNTVPSLFLSSGSLTGIASELISQYFTMGALISPPFFSSPPSRRKQSRAHSKCLSLGWAEGLWWVREARTLGLPRESQPRGKMSGREACELCWRRGDGAHNQDCDPDAGSFINSCVFVSLSGADIICPDGGFTTWMSSLRSPSTMWLVFALQTPLTLQTQAGIALLYPARDP